MQRSLPELQADPVVRAVLALLHAARNLALVQGFSAVEGAVPPELFQRVGIQPALLEELAAGLFCRQTDDFWLVEAEQEASREQGREDCEVSVTEVPAGRAAIDLPRWNSEEGTLWRGGVLVKSVPRWAKNERVLLDLFQANGWAREVRNPFIRGKSPDGPRLRDAVRSLNSGQSSGRLGFIVRRGGQRVAWE